MADSPPDFRLPIEDEHAARWWRDEWLDRHRVSNDVAFKEAADMMDRYIDLHFGGWDD